MSEMFFFFFYMTVIITSILQYKATYSFVYGQQQVFLWAVLEGQGRLLSRGYNDTLLRDTV